MNHYSHQFVPFQKKSSFFLHLTFLTRLVLDIPIDGFLLIGGSFVSLIMFFSKYIIKAHSVTQASLHLAQSIF